MRNSSGTFLGTAKFKPLVIGGGGFVTGFSISTDAQTKVCRTDVFNGWVKGPNDRTWRPLFTTATLPVGEYAGSAGYVAPTSSLVDGPGCFEARVAPSDHNRIYATYNARLYRSEDCGLTWIKTALPDTQMLANTGNQPHNAGSNMAVDPTNADVFLLGTSVNGLYYSTNKGTTMTNVALGTNIVVSGWNVPSKVAVDPTSTVTGGIHQRWFAVLQGTGVYQSTTGPGGPYTLMTGSPTQATDIKFDAAGNCWVCDPSLASKNLWKWTSAGGWVNLTGTAAQKYVTVAVDPQSTGHVVALTDGAYAGVSTDGGATWLGGGDTFFEAYPDSAGTINLWPQSIKWLGLGKKTNFFPSHIVFDPVTSNKLWISEGLGVRWCNPPSTFGSTSKFDWIEETQGIEELVSNWIITPPNGSPIALFWDKAIWRITNPDASPVAGPSIPGGTAKDVQHGWCADYAADNASWLAALVNFSGQHSGYSTDGGATWQKFPVDPPNNGNGGCCAVGNAGNVILVYSNNGQPVYTKDGGSTWATLPFPSLPANGSENGFGWAYYFNRKIISYDKVGGAFYLYNYGPTATPTMAGVYKSTDHGDTWTKVFNGNVTQYDSYNAKLLSVPGNAGHLFFSPGLSTGNTTLFKRSTNGGVTWTTITNVTNVVAYGFGKAAPGQTYPAIYVYGDVGGVTGLWRSFDNCATWTKLTSYPNSSLDVVTVVSGDINVFGRVYVGFSGSGFAYADYDYELQVRAS